MAPLIGFHSVIESPLSVRRVIPPITTIAKTSAATKSRRFDKRARADSPRCGGGGRGGGEGAHAMRRLCACGEPRGKGANGLQ